MPELPFKILGIEHIGIAVNDLNDMSDVFGDLLGLELRGRERIDDQQVITDIYHAGKDKLEFLKATSPNSPITKFLEHGYCASKTYVIIVISSEVIVIGSHKGTNRTG